MHPGLHAANYHRSRNMDSSNAMNINILQQFSQLLFLQSMASGKPLNSMNPAMFGFPHPQQQYFQPDVKPLLLPSPSPTLSDPSKHLQTISDLLSSPSTLKSQIYQSYPSSSSEPSLFKADYENIQPIRQYKGQPSFEYVIVLGVTDPNIIPKYDEKEFFENGVIKQTI